MVVVVTLWCVEALTPVNVVCDAINCLGGAMLDVVVPLLKDLPMSSDKAKLPPLFAAENDHKVGKERKGKGSR